MMATVRLRYRKAGFVPNLILLSIALLFLNAFFALTFFKDLAAIAIAIAVSAIFLITLGVSPFLTDHALAPSHLELHQGWYFRARIALANIERVQVVERGPLRTGIFFELSGDALYVTTQRGDLVLISLKEAQRFGFALGKRAKRVYFDTLDKNELLKSMADKALTPSSPGRSS